MNLQDLKAGKPGQDIVSVSYLSNRWSQLPPYCLCSLDTLEPVTVLLYEVRLLNHLQWKQMLSTRGHTRISPLENSTIHRVMVPGSAGDFHSEQACSFQVAFLPYIHDMCMNVYKQTFWALKPIKPDVSAITPGPCDTGVKWEKGFFRLMSGLSCAGKRITPLLIQPHCALLTPLTDALKQEEKELACMCVCARTHVCTSPN